MYALLFRLVLTRLPAETAHRLGFSLIRLAHRIPGVAGLVRRRFGRLDPALRLRVWDLDLPGPLGLAAGFDKDGLGPQALTALGFGFVEVGTVTAHPQPGNPKPRMFRLPADRALVNRLGFNNQGSAALAARLARNLPRNAVVGVNIGRSRRTAEDKAVNDYVTSAELVAPVADYVVVNVSSPNTAGLRDMQAVERLRPLLVAVREALDRVNTARRVPLLVKIAPDLADEDIDAIADLVGELRLDGVVATNTTIGRDGLDTARAAVAALGPGGLSGPPLRPRAIAVLRRLRSRVPDGCVLVAAGGVETAQDAWERIRAGATLVQAYTGFVYGGPGWPGRVQAGLARRVRAAGLSTIADAIGTEPAEPAESTGPAEPDPRRRG